MRLHLEQQGVEIKRGKVIKISQQNNLKMVHTKKIDYCGKAVVLASGTTRRTLDVPGEKEFLGSGVSYCATCDGAFFKGKTVAVILSLRAALRVYVLHKLFYKYQIKYLHLQRQHHHHLLQQLSFP